MGVQAVPQVFRRIALMGKRSQAQGSYFLFLLHPTYKSEIQSVIAQITIKGPFDSSASDTP